jgi:hypothetical protein
MCACVWGQHGAPGIGLGKDVACTPTTAILSWVFLKQPGCRSRHSFCQPCSISVSLVIYTANHFQHTCGISVAASLWCRNMAGAGGGGSLFVANSMPKCRQMLRQNGAAMDPRFSSAEAPVSVCTYVVVRVFVCTGMCLHACLQENVLCVHDHFRPN